MYQRATVVRNEQVIPGYMRMEVRAAEMAAAAQPGQFMMLRAWEGHVPFLPRPISINYADPAAGTLTFLYKVTGEGTERMAALRAGDGIQALGPLGHGFPLPDAQGALALIGRGIGIAPLSGRLGAGAGPSDICLSQCAKYTDAFRQSGADGDGRHRPLQCR